MLCNSCYGRQPLATKTSIIKDGPEKSEPGQEHKNINLNIFQQFKKYSYSTKWKYVSYRFESNPPDWSTTGSNQTKLQAINLTSVFQSWIVRNDFNYFANKLHAFSKLFSLHYVDITYLCFYFFCNLSWETNCFSFVFLDN